MAKTDQQRLTDTLGYIQTTFGVTQRGIIAAQWARLDNACKPMIHQALSLGGWRPFKSHFGDETTRRHALRAAILVEAMMGDTLLTSLGTYKATHANRTKTQLDALVRAHLNRVAVAATGGVPAVVTAAREGAIKPWSNTAPSKYARWQVGVVPVEAFNCYTALVYWAFQGGAVGHRFLLQWKAASMSFTPPPVNAAAAILKPNGGTIGDNDLADVEAGCTVVFVRVGNPLGHTVMALGDGMCASQNEVGLNFDDQSATPGEWVKARAKQKHIVPLLEYRQHIYKATDGYSIYASDTPFWESIPTADR